ncbi:MULTISPECIES: hypothetical protein [unclassified Deinococcus]|uniref:hypothetical protein n=1 Tax=unclassified Deinococcus TaxID=2623546 RepID=UPI001E61D589|nr:MULTISPECIES: hypothetical protein [unclassified Deinococcus]MCD0161205.1 hypothetical protein [Deinococcus sp. 6YEL10]MCD0168133.1 hypothetical protein [Deinococcus sp. 23YEL01]
MAKLKVAALMQHLRRHAKHAQCRRSFLERAQMRAAVDAEQGLTFLGVGSSCGKPAFALPYPLTWTEAALDRLEHLAEQHFCYVEYGQLAHLKRRVDDRELLAVQDWTPFGVVYVRAEYPLADALLRDLTVTLQPEDTPESTAP